MAAGETLLKVTDFPFAYSFLTILARLFGFDFNDEGLLILIGSGGAFGTFLSIVDPIGRLLKISLRIALKRKEDPNDTKRHDYMQRSIETRAINLEIDKLVSIAYFLIILLSFSTIIVEIESFAEKMQLTKQDGQIKCNTNCIQISGYVLSLSATGIVIIVFTKNCRQLKKHVETAGIYQLGISSEFTTRSTIDSMGKAVDQNDWPTAEKWADKVEKEILTKKGKSDFLIKAIDEVYRPLYIENMNIVSTCQSIKTTRSFTRLPDSEWLKIKTSPAFHMIDDANFITQTDELYSIISKYNNLQVNLDNVGAEIIKNNARKFYGTDVDEVLYWTQNSQGRSAPGLRQLILIGIHPLDSFPKETRPIPAYIELRHSNQKSDILDSKEDIENFEKFWKLLLDDVELNPRVKEVNELFNQILPKAEYLKNELVKKIQMQWMF